MHLETGLLQRLPSRHDPDALHRPYSGSSESSSSDGDGMDEPAELATWGASMEYTATMLFISGWSYVAAMALMMFVNKEIGAAKGFQSLSGYMIWTMIVLYYGSYKADKWMKKFLRDEEDAVEELRREDGSEHAALELARGDLELERQQSDEPLIAERESPDADADLAAGEIEDPDKEAELQHLRHRHKLRAKIITRAVDQIVDAYVYYTMLTWSSVVRDGLLPVCDAKKLAPGTSCQQKLGMLQSLNAALIFTCICAALPPLLWCVLRRMVRSRRCKSPLSMKKAKGLTLDRALRIDKLSNGFNGMMAWIIAVRWLTCIETSVVAINVFFNDNFNGTDYQKFLHTSVYSNGGTAAIFKKNSDGDQVYLLESWMRWTTSILILILSIVLLKSTQRRTVGRDAHAWKSMASILGVSRAATKFKQGAARARERGVERTRGGCACARSKLRACGTWITDRVEKVHFERLYSLMRGSVAWLAGQALLHAMEADWKYPVQWSQCPSLYNCSKFKDDRNGCLYRPNCSAFTAAWKRRFACKWTAKVESVSDNVANAVNEELHKKSDGANTGNASDVNVTNVTFVGQVQTTAAPTAAPSASPSAAPVTLHPTLGPTAVPTATLAAAWTSLVNWSNHTNLSLNSSSPSALPTAWPTAGPSTAPSASPSHSPTGAPTTAAPTYAPTLSPTVNKTLVDMKIAGCAEAVGVSATELTSRIRTLGTCSCEDGNFTGPGRLFDSVSEHSYWNNSDDQMWCVGVKTEVWGDDPAYLWVWAMAIFVLAVFIISAAEVILRRTRNQWERTIRQWKEQDQRMKLDSPSALPASPAADPSLGEGDADGETGIYHDSTITDPAASPDFMEQKAIKILLGEKVQSVQAFYNWAIEVATVLNKLLSYVVGKSHSVAFSATMGKRFVAENPKTYVLVTTTIIALLSGLALVIEQWRSHAAHVRSTCRVRSRQTSNNTRLNGGDQSRSRTE